MADCACFFMSTKNDTQMKETASVAVFSRFYFVFVPLKRDLVLLTFISLYKAKFQTLRGALPELKVSETGFAKVFFKKYVLFLFSDPVWVCYNICGSLPPGSSFCTVEQHH